MRNTHRVGDKRTKRKTGPTKMSTARLARIAVPVAAVAGIASVAVVGLPAQQAKASPFTCTGTTTVTCTFAYIGNSEPYVIPPGITSVTISARGGFGGTGADATSSAHGSGAAGGAGAVATSTVTVFPGETLTVQAGQAGRAPASPFVGGAGGQSGASTTAYAGGGGGISATLHGAGGGGGGGASVVFRGATPLVVGAGGGGGGGGGDSVACGAPSGGIGGDGSAGTTSGVHGAVGITCAVNAVGGFYYHLSTASPNGATASAVGSAGDGGLAAGTDASAGSGTTGGAGGGAATSGAGGGGGGGGVFGGGGGGSGGWSTGVGGGGGAGGGGGSSLGSTFTAAGTGPTNGQVTITYSTSSTLSITTSGPLPNASIGHFYSTTLAATGGTPGYTWSRAGGGLPRGLSLHSGGTISGTVNAYGSYSYTARVRDSVGNTATKTFQLTVMPRADLAVMLFHNGVFHAWQSGGTFSIRVTNTGTAATSTAARNEVRFSVPDGLVVTQGGRGSGWQCSKQRHSSFCTRNASISAGAATTITVTVRVTASGGSLLTSTAKVSPTDFTWGDNTDTDTVFIHS
jgi:hypothetical protein